MRRLIKNFKSLLYVSKLSNFLIFTTTLLFCNLSLANPMGGNVTNGSAVISQTPGVTHIHQSSPKAIINWQSFNINKDEATHFIQPSGGMTLNRISAAQGASQIYGTLTATGKIILINPAGIHFGPSAFVNVGGIIASTANLSDNDFLNDNYHFLQNPDYSGVIVNQGTIIAAENGLVALIGSSVTNEGHIQANMGRAVLGSGREFSMSFAGNDLISFTVDSGSVGGVKNTGNIIANGGSVMISARSASDVLDNVISMSGYVEAKSVYKGENGNIIISGDPKGGTVRLASNMKANEIKVTGYNVVLDSPTIEANFIETSGAMLKVNNASITGSWLIDPDDFTIGTSGNITPSVLATNLNTADVTIQTTLTGLGGNGDIFVNDDIVWNSSHSLTLSAYRHINSNANISNTGSGDLTLRADNTGTGTGTVSFAPGKNVTLNSGSVKVYYNPNVFGTQDTIYSGGTSPTRYMLVNNATNLQNINNNLTENYALGKDINLSGLAFAPIGNSTTAYSGLFDGQGFIVSNLSINQSLQSDIGLFGVTSSSASITNLGVNGNVLGSNNVGLLVGSNAGSISNVLSAGLVTGNNNIGGLVGFNSGDINDSYSLASVVSSGTAAGGLVGQNSVGGFVNNTFAVGASTGSASVGGLIGINNGTLQNSFWDTDTSGQTGSVGTGIGTVTNVVGGCLSGTCTNGGTANLSAANTFSNVGWDTTNIWGIIEGRSYPYLKVIYPSTPRAISGQISQFTSYYTNPAWPVMPDSEKNPLWSSLMPVSLAQQPLALAANGTILDDSTYSGANGRYYFMVRNGAIANSAGLIVYLKGTNKGNVATIAPNAGNSIINLPLALNTLLITSNGIPTFTINLGGYPTWTGLIGVQSINSSTIVQALGNLSNSDLLFTTINSDINVKPTYSFVSGNNLFLFLNGNLTTTNGSITFGGYGTSVLDISPGSNPVYNNTITIETINGGNIMSDATIAIFPFDPNPPPTIQLFSANNIVINAGILPFNIGFGRNGNITLSAANTPQSITTGLSAPVAADTFNLLQGQWYQNFSTINPDDLANLQATFNVNTFNVSPGAQFFRTLGGDGTPSNPFLIIDYEGLQAINNSAYNLQASWKMLNIPGDLNRKKISTWNNGAGFIPIGTLAMPFSGTFEGYTSDGDAYGLAYLTINRPNESYVGLFGVISPTAVISNLWLTGSAITGKDNVGAIVGYNQGGTLYNVGAIKTFVVGDNNVGIIAGVNNGTISNAGSLESRVLGNANVGTLVGVNNGTISNSFAAMSVGLLPNASGLIGGIAGLNAGTIQNSFWDTDVTGRTTAAGLNTGSLIQVTGGCLTGVCKNGGTANLSNINTYLAQGWDITDNWNYATTWDPNSSPIWGIMPMTSTQYSYPYPLGLYAAAGGLPRIFAGTLSSPVSNQLILANWATYGQTIFTSLSPSVTGADGSFYFMFPTAPSAYTSVIDGQIVALILAGDKATGAVLFLAPPSSPTNSGSLMKVPLKVTIQATGKQTDNIAISDYLAQGLFVNLTIAELQKQLATGNINTYLDLQAYNVNQALQRLYANGINFNALTYSSLYSITKDEQTNTYFFEIAGDINDLLTQVNAMDKTLQGDYVISSILPASCKQ